MDVQLTPPVGTCYFKSYKTTFEGEDPPITLNASFYVYATNAKPDSNFTSNGGKVYIVVVYDGLVNDTEYFNYQFGLAGGSKMLSFKKQLPISGSGIANDNYLMYKIDFSQTMSMFTNGGNSTSNFTAHYKNEFSLGGFGQYAVQHVNDWGWVLMRNASHQSPPSINGLQVFEASQLGVAKCTLIQGGTDFFSEPPSKLEYDLDFSAATMMAAKVGG